MGRLVLVLVLAVGVSDVAAGGAQTAITVWATPASSAYGGITYGGAQPQAAGAMITERRELDITSGSEVRITGIAATMDPATVQLRSLTDPGGLAVSEQRFLPGASTPDEILSRHLGDQITVVTAKGDVTGTLRSVDPEALVVEVGTGEQRRLQVMRRDGYVQDVRLPAGKGIEKPTLVWRLATKKPGKHSVELTYRADGLTWSADYLAIYNEAQRTIDFSAWATLKNATGTSFDGAELTLVSGGVPLAPTPGLNVYALPGRTLAPPTRFTVPHLVHVGASESVQVELMPPRTAAKARTVVTYEAIQDLSANYQATGYLGNDCSMLTQTPAGQGRAEVAVELDLPAGKQLPDGRVRVFKRPARAPERLEMLAEDQLRSTAGVARVKLASHSELVGERKTTCNADERARTVTEKVEVKVENKGKLPIDAVVREFLWRTPLWRVDPADENVKSVRAGPQVNEYRVSLPPGAKKSVTYTVVYSW